MIFSKTFHQLEPSLSPIREANRPQDADVTNVNRWCFLLNDILQVSIGVLIQKPIKRNQLVRTLTMERTNWEENGSSSESILTDAKERLVQSRELASVEVIWHLVLQLLQRGNPTCAQSLQAFLGKSGWKPLDYMAFKTSSTSWKRTCCKGSTSFMEYGFLILGANDSKSPANLSQRRCKHCNEFPNTWSQCCSEDDAVLWLVLKSPWAIGSCAMNLCIDHFLRVSKWGLELTVTLWLFNLHSHTLDIAAILIESINCNARCCTKVTKRSQMRGSTSNSKLCAAVASPLPMDNACWKPEMLDQTWRQAKHEQRL